MLPYKKSSGFRETFLFSDNWLSRQEINDRIRIFVSAAKKEEQQPARRVKPHLPSWLKTRTINF